MLEHVGSWLESSGRAFEVRVARTFRRSGANPVEQSFTYVDPRLDLQREGDVVADFRWIGKRDVECSLSAVVECKSSRKESWVGFYDRTVTRMRELDDCVYFQHARHSDVLSGMAALWFGQRPFDFAQVATHVVAAHTKDRVNPASDAVRQVISATEARRKLYIDRQTITSSGLILVPVVVTGAPLVACHVEDSDGLDLKKVERLTVWGHTPDGQRKQVHVVHESAVASFASDLAELVQLARDDVAF